MAAAARVTAGPMPSPDNRTMVFFMVIPGHKRNSGTPRSPQEEAKWRVPGAAISLAPAPVRPPATIPWPSPRNAVESLHGQWRRYLAGALAWPDRSAQSTGYTLPQD